MKTKRVFGMTGLIAAGSIAANQPMNVIFILADDLGWSDTTLYGNTALYETPNLERLAARGMTFTRAYSASPLCSPTRASILTGQTPARNGSTAPQHHLKEVRLKAEIKKSAPPGNKALETESVTRLDTAFPTLGKMIKASGYTTAHFGKWHLGPEPYSPLQHGFDVDVPHWPGPGPAGSYVAPWKFPDFKEKTPKEHIEDRMSEEAVKWMKSVSGKKPFYMNYWMFSVHAPFDAKQELIEQYRKKVDPDGRQRSPTYAAMVHSMDDAVGTLLDEIDRLSIADHTAIIFISDNGGNMYSDVDDTTPTSNFPLRGGKATMYEGGSRVPCVIVWPGVTKPGSRSDEMIQTTDFYPTILDLLGISLPKNYAIDGMDITPALRGGTLDRAAIYTYFPHSPPVPDWLPPAVSVICGDWKLIHLFYQGENGAHDYRLYNLDEDIGETNNIAAAYPEKVKTLDRMIEDYLADSKAVTPQPNPAFDPKFYMPENIGLPKDRHKSEDAAENESWVARGTCAMISEEGSLVIESTGSDPHIDLTKMKKLSGGPFKFCVRMKSSASGNAAVYYNKPGKERTVPFAVQHDGKWHEYQVEVPVSALTGLRLDPATGDGQISVDWIRVESISDENRMEWNF